MNSAAAKADETITFGRERFCDLAQDVMPLLPRHWNEIARNKDKIRLDPDYAAYEAMERAGNLVVCTCRVDGFLCGYACYFIMPRHPHYRARWAISDIFWLDPQFRGRGFGRKLFAAVEGTLKAEGVVVMHTTFKKDHPEPMGLLESMGHTLIELGMAKFIGD